MRQKAYPSLEHCASVGQELPGAACDDHGRKPPLTRGNRPQGDRNHPFGPEAPAGAGKSLGHEALRDALDAPARRQARPALLPVLS